MQGEVLPHVMRGNTEKGGSYRRTPKLRVRSKCLCSNQPRGPNSPCPIPSPTLQTTAAPPQLWVLVRAHSMGRLPSAELPVSAVSLGCSFSPGWGGFCSALVRKRIIGRNKGDFVRGGDGYLSPSSSVLQLRAMLSLSGGAAALSAALLLLQHLPAARKYIKISTWATK